MKPTIPKTNTALLVIDVQNDFMEGEHSQSPTRRTSCPP